MMSSDFSTTTHAKWILAGEHAVLRDHPALVFPLHSKTLTLHYSKSDEGLRTEFSGLYGEEIHLLFCGVLEQALEVINRSISEVQGKFIVENHIPLGAGMGVSAALSVAIVRWFIWQGWLQDDQLQTFAQHLENIFHSESSGVDIAGVLAEQGLLFYRNGPQKLLQPKWKPLLYLCHSNQIGLTSHCVKKVKELWQRDASLAKLIDDEMESSVLSAANALQSDRDIGLPELAAAINKARVCFTQWGLAGGKVEQMINHLLSAGALAAKPTGSGDGGYILSLWSHEPNKDLPFEMIQV
ncbi:MAG: mevalonate kinase [Proteobacteria bacterium]|nr:mevalonate kinase [Pseudomonadota bacterium]